MKKILFMSVLTALLTLAVIFAPNIYKGFLPAAATVRLTEQSYIESVRASGTIVSPDSRNVLTEMPLVIGEVFLGEGDSVSEGQLICSVNRGSTERYLLGLTAGGILPAGFSISELTAVIPDGIYSPYAGTVASVGVRGGEAVGAEAVILTVSGNESLTVKASVSERSISRVSVGQPVVITGSGFDGREYHGRVEYISDSAHRQYSGTAEENVVDIRVSLDDADSKVRSGYSAELRILVAQEVSVRLIPYDAVACDSKGEYAYVFENGMAVRRDIVTGMELSEGVEILKGLYSHDYILTPAKKLTDGEYVVLTEHESEG